MKCSNCGDEELQATWRRCKNCGAPNSAFDDGSKKSADVDALKEEIKKLSERLTAQEESLAKKKVKASDVL